MSKQQQRKDETDIKECLVFRQHEDSSIATCANCGVRLERHPFREAPDPLKNQTEKIVEDLKRDIKHMSACALLRVYECKVVEYVYVRTIGLEKADPVGMVSMQKVKAIIESEIVNRMGGRIES